VTVREIRKELLQLYRYYFDGNSSAPDGTEIHVAIHAMETKLKEKKHVTH